MRVKTSITISTEAIQAIDEIAGETRNRSRIIELAIFELLERRRRQARDARDLEILDRDAEALDEEMADVLSYQVGL